MKLIRTTRLRARGFWVEVRWACIDGRWIASADAPGGPTLGLGSTALEALSAALGPFDGTFLKLRDTLADDPENA